MSWSWSHTNEAYANANANLREMSRETLLDIHAEWLAHETGAADSDPEGFSPSTYERERARLTADDIPADTLANAIWARARDAATCTNGGWLAYVCPYGCGPHLVSFSRDDNE